jgi:outer membrane assembly lipoprotein YfiO
MKNIKNSFPMLFIVLGLSLLAGCAKKDKESSEKPKVKVAAEQKNSFEVEEKAVKVALSKNKKDKAVELLEKMMESFQEHKDVHEWRLKLGDLYYEMHDYEKGDVCYKAYRKLNPSKGEYASYRSILCTHNQSLDPEHDQSFIHKTISRCKRHLDNEQYKVGKHAQDIKDIKYTCEQKLVEREFYVLKFYMRQGQVKAAENRLKYIKENLLAKNPGLEDRVLYCESKLAIKQNKKDEAEKIGQVLLARHPESPYSDKLKRALEPKSGFIFA